MTNTKYNILFKNGNINTMNNSFPKANWFVTENDFITFAGLDSDYKYLKMKFDKIIDFENNNVFPGFHDSHLHLVSYALKLGQINCRKCSSANDLAETIHLYNKKFHRLKWLIGHSFDESKFSDNKSIDRLFLDNIEPDKPLILERICGHKIIANTAACKRICLNLNLNLVNKNFNKPFRYIDEGIEVDDRGFATGVFCERALGKIQKELPKTNNIELKNYLCTAMNNASKMGITSVQSVDNFQLKSWEKTWDVYNDLKQNKKLKIRVTLQSGIGKLSSLHDFIEYSSYFNKNSKWLQQRGIKLFLDGSFGAQTAALTKPYNSSKNTGILNFDNKSLEQIVTNAWNNNIQVLVHAIGDAAIEQILKIYLNFIKNRNTIKSKSNLPLRLVHFSLTNSYIFSLIDEIYKMGYKLGADIQPQFIPSDSNWLLKYLGKSRLDQVYNFNSLFNKNILLSLSSDCPIENFDPIKTLELITTRNRLNLNSVIDTKSALKAYTVNPAIFEDTNMYKGKIAPNMLADFVILDNNNKVVSTYIGAKQTYKK